jgi:hypothetical protein
MASTKKLDLYKTFAADYAASRTPTLVEPHAAQYLAIEGQGEPGGTVFGTRLGLLYNVAFTIKMAKKFAGIDYAVCKLEGLWWGQEKQGTTFLDEPRSQWRWQLLIRTPAFIKASDRSAALHQLRDRGKDPAVADVKLMRLDEGRSIQMLHVGPYDTEPESLERMHALARTHGLQPHRLHHEIYLSDPRRVPAARLKTILRMPVRTGRAA